MELEQRVKTLEYEVKILKNEIQRTLLDIQEQILVHYYPTLRADNEVPSEVVAKSLESIRERRDSTGEEQASASPVKKISLKDLEGPAEDNGNSSGEAKGLAQEEAMRLSKWVSESVGRIGKERTARLIESCVSSGWIDPDSKTVLQRFASLSDEGSVPKVVPVNDVLAMIMELNPLIDQEIDVDKALSLIEEADLG